MKTKFTPNKSWKLVVQCYTHGKVRTAYKDVSSANEAADFFAHNRATDRWHKLCEDRKWFTNEECTALDAWEEKLKRRVLRIFEGHMI